MKTSVIFGGAAALGLLVTAAVVAQTTATPASSSRMAAGGGLTLQQFQMRQERKMFARDTNGDGKISRAEFIAGAKAGKGDPAARFAKLDRNGDGVIDKAELDASIARRFRRLDTNGDGVLTVAERAAGKHHAARRGAAGANPAD